MGELEQQVLELEHEVISYIIKKKVLGMLIFLDL